MTKLTEAISVKTIDVPLNNNNFVKSLLNHLSGSLQDVIGLEEAEGFISIVGSKLGEQIDFQYREALNVEKLSRTQLTEVLIDLKARIDGDFYVLEEFPDKIVFGNKHCPFGSDVFDRPALCMMTSNVFGVIAAENTGYAKVSIDESIARNHDHCKVTVYLSPDDTADGREYYCSDYFLNKDVAFKSILNAYSLPTAICNKHGELLECSGSFQKLWPSHLSRNVRDMFLESTRWQNDWRMVRRNKIIELIETRLCEPLHHHMLRTSRLGVHDGELLFLIELHPRKEFTEGFKSLAGYYLLSQRQKHRSHMINLQMQNAIKESYTDPLTRIANRRAFDERIQEIWQDAILSRHPVVLLSVDIDHFKLINDKLGHSRGDEILVQVAQCLDKLLSRGQDVVARVGGEEFSMILPDTQPDGGRLKALSAVTAIEMLRIPHPASPVAEFVTISLGCSSYEPRPGDNVKELITAADKALYFAKKAGRNCASYTDVKKQTVSLITA